MEGLVFPVYVAIFTQCAFGPFWCEPRRIVTPSHLMCEAVGDFYSERRWTYCMEVKSMDALKAPFRCGGLNPSCEPIPRDFVMPFLRPAFQDRRGK
jgi:hypothetical protein